MCELCPNFNQCGGCLYLNLSQADYKNKKTNFIRRAFLDKGIDVALDDMISIPFGLRRRATFSFDKGKVGFNSAKSHKIVDLNACPALVPELSALLPILKKLCAQIGGKGDVFVQITPFGIDMHIKKTKSELTLQKRELFAQFAHNYNIARFVFNNEPVVQQAILPYPIDCFMQPSELGEKTLIDLVLNALDAEKTALDLFCGMGTFTKPLLNQKIKVTGYDIGDGVSVLGANGVNRDLFRNPIQLDELKGIDVVILDPPRAGAKAQVELLAQSKVQKIIMVSCNPVTASRDCKILLDAGYKITKITPVDQFVYSNHVELVIVLQ